MSTRDPGTIKELETMLHYGKGRAILYLLGQDLASFCDLILDNCLNDYTYDHQSEDPRADYLYPLISASGQEDYYREAILKSLLEEEDSDRTEHRLDFALIFARNGDQSVRDMMYEKLRRSNADSGLLAADHLISLDGIQGLLAVLEVIGENPDLRTEWDHLYIKHTEKITGIDEVRRALQEAASASRSIAAALNSIDDYSPYWTVDEIERRREERKEKFAQLPVEVDENTTWEEVKSSPHFCRISLRWASVASEWELEKAARDLNPDDDPVRLRHHLWIFSRYPFPIRPEPLIKLIDHSDEGVAIGALNALELVYDPKVRELFERIKSGHKWSCRAIGLLRSNYQPGDDRLIVDLLASQSDPDILHVMCINVREVYKANETTEAAAPLILAYDKTPCSACRYSCVRDLSDIASVPDWMIEELPYDAYEDTRKLAAELKP